MNEETHSAVIKGERKRNPGKWQQGILNYKSESWHFKKGRSPEVEILLLKANQHLHFTWELEKNTEFQVPLDLLNLNNLHLNKTPR